MPRFIAGVPFTDTEDTTGTTSEAGEPLDCGMTGATVWYRFTATAGGSLVADTFGSDFDTVLTVYRATAPAPTFADLELVDCNDQADGDQSLVEFHATAAETYYFQAGGWSGGLPPPLPPVIEPAQGNLVFKLNQGAAGDDLADAEVIAGMPYTDAQNTTGTSSEPGEPQECAPVDGTVWYRFTPSADGSLVADTLGSDFDTVLTVYRTTQPAPTFADLEVVGCNDDSRDLTSMVGFEATAGTNYYFQVGGYSGSRGNLIFDLNLGASIAGTVTNPAGDPLEGVCAEIFDGSDGFSVINAAVTDQEGNYSVALAPGSYKVHFFDCENFAYDDEWYDNRQDYLSADVLDLDPGVNATGTDAVLGDLVQPPGPQPDLDITELTVANVPIMTDSGPVGYTGWMRKVTVTVTNSGDKAAVDSYLDVLACPRTEGRCTFLGFEFIGSLEPGGSKTFVLKWNGLGSVGDYTVSAAVWNENDANYDNNYESVEHYVIVGGTGIGVGAGDL